MTKDEIAAARSLALDYNQSLSDYDDSVLRGLVTRDFKPVFCDIRVVARTFRDFIMIGSKDGQDPVWDEPAINEVCQAARYKIRSV